PYNHQHSANKVIATGLTDDYGNFSVIPSQNFYPATGDIFTLEAVRRIGGAGNNAISIRTFIRWNGNSWEGMTTPGLMINTKTTALAIISANQAVNPGDTIGTIDVSSGTSVPAAIGSVTAQQILDVAELVTTVLNEDNDPYY